MKGEQNEEGVTKSSYIPGDTLHIHRSQYSLDLTTTLRSRRRMNLTGTPIPPQQYIPPTSQQAPIHPIDTPQTRTQ